MILGNHCSPLTEWIHTYVMHSRALLSPFDVVWIMRFYPVHAHAVLIDSISTILQSIVTGTVSMQPLQDHEVSTVHC